MNNQTTCQPATASPRQPIHPHPWRVAVLAFILVLGTGCNFHLGAANGMLDVSYENKSFGGLNYAKNSDVDGKGKEVHSKTFSTGVLEAKPAE